MVHGESEWLADSSKARKERIEQHNERATPLGAPRVKYYYYYYYCLKCADWGYKYEHESSFMMTERSTTVLAYSVSFMYEYLCFVGLADIFISVPFSQSFQLLLVGFRVS